VSSSTGSLDAMAMIDLAWRSTLLRDTPDCQYDLSVSACTFVALEVSAHDRPNEQQNVGQDHLTQNAV
jgi:hypothetical protein